LNVCFRLQVDDGNDNVLLDGSDSNCDSVDMLTTTVTAPSSWMKVQFTSDGINATSGFRGIIKSTFVGK